MTTTDYGSTSTLKHSVSQTMEPSRKITSFEIIGQGVAPNTKEISLRALIINFCLLYGFGITGAIISKITGVYFRGFFCDDDSIRLGYKKDTVTSTQLIIYTIMLNVVAVILVETYRVWRIESLTPIRYRCRNSEIHQLIVRYIKYIGYSQIGYVCVFVLTNITKNVIGRLRPHFLDVCNPRGLNCTSENEHHYIEQYDCTGSPEKVKEGRKSFFSGHSSFAMYASVWAALYIQARLKRVAGNRIIVPILQTILISIGLAISYSRINDHMHHWSDVIVGIFIGSFIAAYNCLCWTDLFDKHKTDYISAMPTTEDLENCRIQETATTVTELPA